MTEKITAKEYRDMQKRPTRSKYNARKTVVDGITFDSKKEARRYEELKLQEKVGAISHLQLQPKFRLLDGFKHSGETIRPINYFADFSYIDAEGNEVVEDVKSKATKTPVYSIKKKLFLNKYGERYVFIET